MQQSNRFKYFAFISYSSHDQEWGKRLQRKLEHYRMPATLCSEYGWERTPIKPVFFAPTDIQLGGLTEELQERLGASRNLIVICSPHSAQSEWVGKEIEFFHSLGRTENIHFFIVDGTPHSGNPDTECFNPIVETLGLPEILGANIHEKIYRQPWLNRERAYVQLISKLLGVEFDAIWQRHRRLLVRRIAAWTLGIIAVMAALGYTWRVNQPFDAEIQLVEASTHNEQLPPLTDAVVTVTLDNETKSDTIGTLDKHALFPNIPYRYHGKEVRIQVSCNDFLETDTVMVLNNLVEVAVYRNPDVYGKIRVRLWDTAKEMTFPKTEVVIEGRTVTSDDSGYVKMQIPLHEQRQQYRITSTNPKIENVIVMPNGPDDVVTIKQSNK